MKSTWLSFKELYADFKKYAELNLFCIAYDGKGKIHCNRAYKCKKKSDTKVNDRMFSHGPLRCGYQFYLQ